MYTKNCDPAPGNVDHVDLGNCAVPKIVLALKAIQKGAEGCPNGGHQSMYGFGVSKNDSEAVNANGSWIDVFKRLVREWTEGEDEMSVNGTESFTRQISMSGSEVNEAYPLGKPVSLVSYKFRPSDRDGTVPNGTVEIHHDFVDGKGAAVNQKTDFFINQDVSLLAHLLHNRQGQLAKEAKHSEKLAVGLTGTTNTLRSATNSRFGVNGTNGAICELDIYSSDHPEVPAGIAYAKGELRAAGIAV